MQYQKIPLKKKIRIWIGPYVTFDVNTAISI